MRMIRLVTERDASECLGVSVRTLQKWRLQGSGPRFVKLGHAVRYDGRDLDPFALRSSRICDNPRFASTRYFVATPSMRVSMRSPAWS